MHGSNISHVEPQFSTHGAKLWIHCPSAHVRNSVLFSRKKFNAHACLGEEKEQHNATVELVTVFLRVPYSHKHGVLYRNVEEEKTLESRFESRSFHSFAPKVSRNPACAPARQLWTNRSLGKERAMAFFSLTNTQ